MSVTLLISIDFNEVFNVRFRNELHKRYLLSAISVVRLQNLAVKTTLKSVAEVDPGGVQTPAFCLGALF